MNKNFTEIKKYEKMLKDNEATIAELTSKNKHIKAHLKFLKDTDEDDGTISSTLTSSRVSDATLPEVTL